MDRVRNPRWWLGGALAAVGLYAALVTLGVAPIPAAVVERLATLAAEEVLVVLLAVSLVANVSLGLASVAFWRRATRARREGWNAALDRMRGFGDTLIGQTSWLPDDAGALPFGVAELEAEFQRGSEAGVAEFGPDARVDVHSIKLNPGASLWLVGASEVGQKSFSVDVVVGGQVAVLNARRRSRALPTDAQLWRADSSWQELTRMSWARMRPFEGDVKLRPRRSRDGQSRWWAIEYTQVVDKVRGPTQTYYLEDGELVEDL